MKQIVLAIFLILFTGCGETDADFTSDDNSIYNKECIQDSNPSLCGYEPQADEQTSPPTFPCQDKENCK